VVADDAAEVRFEGAGNVHRHDTGSGKPAANVTRYAHTDGDDAFGVTYTRHRDLAAARLIDEFHGPKKVAALLVGFDGAYLRFTGELRIEYRHVGTVADRYASPAIWELMYLGLQHRRFRRR
jgi:hypothetical protein